MFPFNGILTNTYIDPSDHNSTARTYTGDVRQSYLLILLMIGILWSYIKTSCGIIGGELEYEILPAEMVAVIKTNC